MLKICTCRSRANFTYDIQSIYEINRRILCTALIGWRTAEIRQTSRRRSAAFRDTFAGPKWRIYRARWALEEVGQPLMRFVRQACCLTMRMPWRARSHGCFPGSTLALPRRAAGRAANSLERARSIDGAPGRHPGLEFGIFEAVGAVVDASHELQLGAGEAPNGRPRHVRRHFIRAQHLLQLPQCGAPV